MTGWQPIPRNLAAQLVSFEYHSGKPVLDGISLSAGPGELVVLLGANGAGKSTLLRLLAGQLQLSGGIVTLDGKSITQYTHRELAKQVAFMSQFETIDSDLTVRQVVRLGRIPHRGWWLQLTSQDELAVDQALNSMCLVELQDQAARTLSGGQWRRTMLARALAQQASVLLLDEPIAGLDIRYQTESLQLLKYHAQANRASIVISMHDLNLASLFSSRIVLLKGGTIVASGTATEVLTEAHLQTAFGVQAKVVEHPELTKPMVLPCA